jgi:D-alanine-D-alanine ligase
MRIGLTYDLRSDYLKQGYSEEETAEFDAEVTIDAIEKTLNELRYPTERIGNIKSLVNSIATGKRWDLVFNISEGMYGTGREAQVPALLDAYKIPYVFSDPLVMALTLHKGHTKRVIGDYGIPTADFAVIETIEDAKKVNLPYPLFVKPVAEGTGKGIDAKSKVMLPFQLFEACENLLNKYNQPVLVETYLPGREFTVGIVGTGSKARVVGVMEIVVTAKAPEAVYSYTTKENWHGVVEYSLATGRDLEACSKVALSAWRVLGCRDGGRIDLKMDSNGVPNFIEVNPLAGINPDHSDLPMLARKNGIPYKQLIRMIMNSAMSRVKINANMNLVKSYATVR